VAAVPEHGERARTAELVAALCLATDLGMAFPFEHGLHTTLIAMRLADRLSLDRESASQTYYACLLSYAGCTAEAHVAAEVFGGSLTVTFNPVMYGSGREVVSGLLRTLSDPDRSLPVRAAQTVRRMPRMAREQGPALTAACEVAGMLASRVGAPSDVSEVLSYLTDRWDGKGPLRRARGDEIPLPMRIVQVAADASLQRLLGGADHAARLVRERAGRAFDPDVAGCLVSGAPEILALDAVSSAWDEVLAVEPSPQRELQGEALDRALAAMGNFADLVSPSLAGHSGSVAELVDTAAARCGVDEAGRTMVRRAGLLHDLGRVAVHPRIWQKTGPLTAGEWEQVRLHPYHTERILSRSPFLAALAPVAGAHHERLDGSGYHRGAAAPELGVAARLLAAADAYRAMTEPRPYRTPLPPEEAARELAEDVSAGRLDPDAVGAVLEAAGQSPPRLERPAGLTEREAEVITMLAGGLQTKQVAHALGISAKTADRHVQNAYRKIGVSSRAAATLFAMEHGLIAWGELPIAGHTERS
jgi:HD-GYP domain-containing protein (c-di-GMP phosphodiesterase class II)